MNILRRNKWHIIKPYLLLMLILFFAYLPLSTFYFGMKNDAFSDNFPNKFFLSEALHSGMLPLWNPYMNFGYPVYADMGFAFYNPITWLFAFMGYNAYTLTLEVLCYIYIAGICMYRLGRYLRLSFYVSLSVAIMYMCSGFFAGQLQHINFLTAAAFLPLLLQFFLKLLYSPSYANSFYCSTAAYFVAVSGHPSIPIAAIYFFLILLILLLIFNHEMRRNILKIVLHIILTIGLLIIFLAPLIYSYLNIFPEYKRYAVINPGSNLYGFFDLPSFLSLILPLSTITHSSFFSNDVSNRSMYFSLLGVLFLFFGFRKRENITFPLLITALFMLFFSLGEPYKHLVFDKLPLFLFVKTNGEYCVFAILCFCCIAGFGLTRIENNVSLYNIFLKKICRFLFFVTVSFAIVLIINNLSEVEMLLNKINRQTMLTSKVKIFLSELSLSIAVAINLLIAGAIFFVTSIQKKISSRFFALMIITDLAINTILCLPVTGVGETTISEIQNVYNKSPKGITMPALIPINKIDTLDTKTTGLVGDISYYNKQIGTTKLTDYPSYFTATNTYFKSAIKKNVETKPFVFLQSRLKDTKPIKEIIIKAFSPLHIVIEARAIYNDTLILLQNNYKFWKAKVNNKPVKLSTAYEAFIAVPVTSGVNIVAFDYYDPYLLPLILFALCFFLAQFIYLRKKKEKINSSH